MKLLPLLLDCCKAARQTSPPPASPSSSSPGCLPPHRAVSAGIPSSSFYTRMCYLVLRSLIILSKATGSGQSIGVSSILPGQVFESVHSSIMTSSVWVSEALRTVCCLQSHVETLCLAAKDTTDSSRLPQLPTRQSSDSPMCGFNHDDLVSRDLQVTSSDNHLEEVNRPLSLTEGGALMALVGCLHVAVREGLASRNPQTRSRAAHVLDALRRLGCQPKVSAGQCVSHP